jgi:glycosyltransferase involved in cell wall biosynthesis
MNLSLAITTFNRYELTIESFAQVIDDPRIDDIVIFDDCSTDGSHEKIRKHFSDNTKVTVLRQKKNVGMSLNKHDAIAAAKNEWCIIFDSDNIIGPDYLDAFFNLAIDGEALTIYNQITNIEKFIFCPDFAKPEFDYGQFKIGNGGIGIRAGIYAARQCAHEIKNDSFNCLMNTCNYIVHRDNYLETYQYNPNHIASDTVWHNYNHLKSGGLFVVVPGMQYFHRVHKGSGFLQGVDHNMRMQNEVRKMIMELK